MPTAVHYFKTALGAPGPEIAKFEINSYSKLTQFFGGLHSGEIDARLMKPLPRAGKRKMPSYSMFFSTKNI